MGKPAEKDGKPAEIIEFPGSDDEQGTVRSDAKKADSAPVSSGLLSGIDADTLKKAQDIFYQDGDSAAGLRTGARLKMAREQLGVSLEELASETRIKKSYLEALESMYVGIITPGYLTPILRTYAKALNLPAEDIVKSYTAECGAVETVKETSQPAKSVEAPELGGVSSGGQINARLIGGGAIAAAVLIAGVFWGFTSLGHENTAEPVTRIIANAPAVNGGNESLFADTERLATTQLPLELAAVSQGWIEIRGADGTIFRSRMMSAGETYLPRLGAGWTVSARDGAAFEWRVGNAVLGPLGPEGAPVYALSIDTVASDAAQSLTPAMASAIDGQPTR